MTRGWWARVGRERGASGELQRGGSRGAVRLVGVYEAAERASAEARKWSRMYKRSEEIQEEDKAARSVLAQRLTAAMLELRASRTPVTSLSVQTASSENQNYISPQLQQPSTTPRTTVERRQTVSASPRAQPLHAGRQRRSGRQPAKGAPVRYCSTSPSSRKTRREGYCTGASTMFLHFLLDPCAMRRRDVP